MDKLLWPLSDDDRKALVLMLTEGMAPISGGAAIGGAALIAMLIPLVPQFIQLAMTLAHTIGGSPETPEEVKIHYARIAAALDATNALVQSAPLPPVGSGR